MSAHDELDKYLSGLGLKELEAYANRVGPEILMHSEGFAVAATVSRIQDVDWENLEIVIEDTVTFRISGPPAPHVNARPERSRCARRQASARRERAGRSRKTRH